MPLGLLNGYEEQDVMAPQAAAPAISPMVQQMPAQAAPMQQLQPQYINPYLDALQSPLMTPERQNQTGELYDRYVNYLMKDDDRRRGEAAEDSATKIFGNIVAPAMALFGGPGTSAAGVQMMQDARQQVAQARQRKNYEQQASLSAIKSLVDISKTGLKPAQAYVADFRKGIDQQQKAAALQQKTNESQAKLDFRKTLLDSKEKYQTSLLDLKKRGLDISEDKMKQQREIADQNHNRIMKIAQINAQIQMRGQDQNLLRMKEQEMQAYKRDEIKLNQFNSEIQAKLSERDSKGNYKYLDSNGKPLDPGNFQLQQGEFQSGFPEPSDDDIAATMQELNSMQAVPAPQQQVQGQVAPAAAGGAEHAHAQIFKSLTASGMAPEMAAQMFVQSAQKRGIPLSEAFQMLQGMGYGKKQK